MEQKDFENIVLLLQQGNEAIKAGWDSVKAAVVSEYQNYGLTEQLKQVERSLATNFARGLCWLQNCGIEWDMAIMEDCFVATLNGYYINDQFIENPDVSVADKVRILGRVLDNSPAGREIFYYFNKMINNPQIPQQDRQLIGKRIVEQGLTDGFGVAAAVLGKTKEELTEIYNANLAASKPKKNDENGSVAAQDEAGTQPGA